MLAVGGCRDVSFVTLTQKFENPRNSRVYHVCDQGGRPSTITNFLEGANSCSHSGLEFPRRIHAVQQTICLCENPAA